MNIYDQLPGATIGEQHVAPRAALYMRVSTGRQAEHDLSIPDQRSQLNSWCRAMAVRGVAGERAAGRASGDAAREGSAVGDAGENGPQ